MIEQSRVGIIIAAAGSGKRMGGKDKLYRKLDGISVLARSALAFEKSPLADAIVLAVREGTEDVCRQQIVERYGLKKVCAVVPGGAERSLSVRAALNSLPADCGVILIHDGARPLVSQEIIDRVSAASLQYGAVVPAVPVKDTIKSVDTEEEARWITGTPSRSLLRAVQTPQGFQRDILWKAYRMDCDEVPEQIAPATDDASLVEAAGFPVATVEGDENNLKITTLPDLSRAEQILKDGKRESMQRIGIGYDVHAFAPDRRLVLGGVEIPWDRGLAGHSDADVLVHAIMDALLGAAALGDIGQHFPDSDERYRGIDSMKLLAEVRNLLEREGWKPCNLDAVVIAQKPKLAPHIPSMREAVAEVLEMPLNCVSIKATTTERLGFTGREEGIAAQAAASLLLIQEEELS